MTSATDVDSGDVPNGIPTYCADDGAKLTIVEDDIAAKSICPTCDRRHYDSILSQALWRMPEAARSHAMKALRVAFDRPRVTPKLSIVRLAVLAALPYAIAQDLGITENGAILPILSVIAVFVLGIGAPLRLNELAPDAEGWSVDVRDLGFLAVLGYQFKEAIASTLANPPTFVIPALPFDELTSFATFVGIAFLTAVLFSSVTVAVHEYLHWLAFRAIGVEARIEYGGWHLFGMRIVTTEGEVIPTPSSWRGSEWEHLVTGAAPLVMWAPTLALLYAFDLNALSSQPLPFAALVWGLGAAWVTCSIPSSGDLGVLGQTRHLAFAEVEQQAENHALAEGAEVA